MNILILNGSPKGDISVTMQYMHYLKKIYPNHEYEIINIAYYIKKIEKNQTFFDEIIDKVKKSDAVIWAFPLYVLHVHANYKRFIELIWEKNVEDAFKDKYAISFSTSINFFDYTAHDYMNGIADDLKMRYFGYYSANSRDLMKEDERKNYISFMEDFFNSIDRKAVTNINFSPIQYSDFEYKNCTTNFKKIDQKSKKILVVSDSNKDSINLNRMLEQFKNLFTNEIEIINLNDINIKSSCRGCLECGYNNVCFFDDKDDIRNLYEEKMRKADIIVFACCVKDRYLSAKWKTLVDRRFFITHQPMLPEKHIAYIISGPIGQIHNLREVLSANAELDSANLVDIVSDEYNDSEKIDNLLHNLANRLLHYSNKGTYKPKTFLGKAGYKLFRDEIYGNLRFVFRSDHKYYKKHKYYDFPQKDWGVRFANLVFKFLLLIPKIRKGFQKNMKHNMIRNFKKIVE